MTSLHDLDPYYDEDVYDDPYEVVMYDIDTSDDDLFTIIAMLGDDTRSWYAKRRLNALVAAGPLSELVAAVIIDSLGRRWDPLLHPRDRFGQFIETGGFFRWLMNDNWLRGQVSRIDSDGVIHARSLGNDSVPDGSMFRFKPEQASKLVSTAEPVASLDAVDLDADIPDFPEASDIQKRIWNNLGFGDIPAEDLDRSLRDLDLSVEDLSGELQGLKDRGLIDITPGDKPRIRRGDDDDLGVTDVGDDEIADVPDDETPDLDDSPAFTKAQRDLLDRIVEADRGEGDGVGREEIADAADEDVQALVNAGALEENDDGRLFLENPAGGDAPEGEPAVEPDISQEIFDAAAGVSDDPDVQEAFQHFAEELARPGDANNIPLPEGLAPAKQRNAESAARKWWEDRDPETRADEAVLDQREEDDFADQGPVLTKDVVNPRNQAMADTLMGEFFPGEEFEEFLDGPNGVEYAGAVKRLFDAEDLEENGFDTQAEAERFKADRAFRRLEVPEEDIEGWPLAVQNARDAEKEQSGEVDAPETAEDVLPEPAAEEVDPLEVADEQTPPEEAVEEEAPDAAPAEGNSQWDRYESLMEAEGKADNFYDRLTQENRIASDLGLDLLDDDAPWTWENLAEQIGFRPAELMFEDSDGSIGIAATKNPDIYINQYENELLSKFQKNPGNLGPEVLRLRHAGLIEASDEGNSWQLTQDGRQRLGLSDTLPEVDETPEVDAPDVDAPEAEEAVPDDVVDAPEADVDAPEQSVEEILDEEEALAQADDAAEDVVPDDVTDDTAEQTLSDEERALLEQVRDGGQARRSQRETEDALHERGLLEEDDSGDSRLTDSGKSALGDSDAEEVVDEAPVDVDAAPDEVAEAETPVEDVDVPEDVVDVDAQPVDDSDTDAVDDAAPAPSTSGPTLPDPSDPNDATPGFRKISGSGGLNDGGMYEVTEDNGHLKTGDTVYIKNGRSPEHAQNEVTANRLYALAGVSVPELALGSTGDRLVSKVVDDVRPLNAHDPAERPVLDQIRSQFAVDAWIANWDGMLPGNTMITPDGTPYRIDVGSAMEFRAQGGLKGAAFADTVNEFDALRNPSINYEAALVFGPMSDDEVKASVSTLANLDPEEIRSTILASDLPDKDALADKMVARRSNALSHFGIADPHAAGDGSADVDDAIDAVDTPAPAPTAAPTAATAKSQATKTAAAIKRLKDFENRTNPHLEAQYDGSGRLVMADGSSLSFTQHYHTGKGGEGKHGLVVEVLDQERYPGLVKMEFQDGSQQVRHVLGVNSGKGGLRPSSQEDVDEWERQARVQGEQAEEAVDPADFPMADGNAPLAGTQIAFQVGGEDQYGVLLYFNPLWDNGGRAYIIPEGGGKVIEKPVRTIRTQTQSELDSDATPTVPYEYGKITAQYLPSPRFDANGNIMSREDQPIHMGDWLAQRAGGDGLVGRVVDIPDQNLYPGWITLEFPDGEVRSRHVEGFTAVGKLRGAGGLKHVDAPDPDTWTRVRRVKGEEGDVLSYDFSSLETSDGTPIQVGQAAFGRARNGREVAGLLIRINPHTKRDGEVVPTGFIWENGREIPVDVAKITNTRPATVQRPTPTRRPTPAPTRAPAPARSPRQRTATRTARSQPGVLNGPANRPPVSPANTPPAYTPAKGSELSDDQIAGLDFNSRRLYTSERTNGVHAGLAAVYEAQDFDALPEVVDQIEYARLVREEGYVPIVRSMSRGTDPTTSLPYEDAYKYGAYYAGDGIHGHGSYFAYGDTAFSETQYYGPSRVYAVVKPEDLRSIDKTALIEMQSDELTNIRRMLKEMEADSEEYKALKSKQRLLSDLGEYAAVKGYDAVIIPRGNGHNYGVRADDNLEGEGYIIVLNRSATIVSDTMFPDSPNIFNYGLPTEVAPDATGGVV